MVPLAQNANPFSMPKLMMPELMLAHFQTLRNDYRGVAHDANQQLTKMPLKQLIRYCFKAEDSRSS